MKTVLLLGLLLVSTTITALAGNPTTFEEFRQLPKVERDAMLADKSASTNYQLYRWGQRLHMGEEAWMWEEKDSIIHQYGFTALGNLFNEYQHLRESFLLREWIKVQSTSASPAELANKLEIYKKNLNATSNVYHDIIPLLANVAPTAEAHGLNKLASDLLDKWTEKWPAGSDWVVTTDEMATIDKAESEILSQVKALKKLTPEEMQKAVDTLPENDPRNGLPIPTQNRTTTTR